MTDNKLSRPAWPALSRRGFVHGLAVGGALAAAPGLVLADGLARRTTRTGTAPELRGSQFDLVVEETLVDYAGKVQVATSINGSIPAPTLRLREGDEVTIRVTNRLREITSIHWHGILLPWQMDGVPGISFAGIAPGETFTYRFRLRQSGTYWYHSHSGSQEQTGMYGALIVEPRDQASAPGLREHVVLLSDWLHGDPMRVLAHLKTQSDYYNFNQPTVPAFFDEVSRDGLGAALDRRRMWQQMRMNPTDLADLSSAALSHLCNGLEPAEPWLGLYQPGEKVRLRCINGSANTFYDLRIPGLPMTVVQSDGVDVEPVTVDEFRFGPGETYDVLVTPDGEAHCVFAQSMDRSGFACGVLAEREGLQPGVPEPDAPLWLSMTDMMGDGMHSGHGGHAMGGAEAHVRHASSEFGPSVDMLVDQPRRNLDDPGIGLRDNGRRVLTLADLVTVGGPLDPRDAGREIELHLTGNMERYSWSLDGLEFGSSTPVAMRHGERLRVILHNDTMMTHPMHLHGLWSELENTDGGFQARLHTIPVQPAQRISFLVDASEPGRWAWHCHLMLHMHMGMFREVVVS